MKGILQSTVSITIFLILWEITSRSGAIPITLFPPPTQVTLAFFDWLLSGELLDDSRTSLWRAIAGFAIGSSVAIIIGVLTGRLAIVNAYLSPIIQLLRPLPPVAIIPLVIVWFGIGELSKVFSIAFAVFFPVWLNTHSGVQGIPKTFFWSAKMLKIEGLSILWKVILPASLPFILNGLRNGIAIAFVMVFVSELAGASSGIGYRISVSNLAYRIDQMIAALVVLGCCGAIADTLLANLLWRIFPWLRLSQQK
jgi:ABC-type nitrate/sulfonate/bicarbonate transport system permease component